MLMRSAAFETWAPRPQKRGRHCSTTTYWPLGLLDSCSGQTRTVSRLWATTKPHGICISEPGGQASRIGRRGTPFTSRPWSWEPMVLETRSKDMNNFTITHKGLFFYIIPIYLDMRDEYCPAIAGRHWIFEPFLMVMDALFSAADYVADRLFGAELTMPMLITGEIGADGAP